MGFTNKFKEVKCKYCKKMFLITDTKQWVYKIDGSYGMPKKYFCSWSCLRNYKK